MSGQSLGLIETVGLAVAVEAADAAMKSANVDLIGYELTKGGGLVTVKLTGEVGAINAAVAAGVAAANRVGSVYAWKVIARTATGIDELIASKETCGTAPQEPVVQNSKPAVALREDVVPVVNVEPAVTASDCLIQERSMIADISPLPETECVHSDDATPIPQEATSEKLASTQKKPQRTRAKGTRR